MASIILRLDNRTTKNGMQQVRMRISHKGTNAWHPTGVWVEPVFFNSSNIYEAISKRAPMAMYKREQLAGIVRQYEEGVFDLLRADGGQQQLDQMTANDIRAYIYGTREKKPTAVQLVAKKKKSHQTADFMAFLDKYGQSKDKVRTRENYAYVYRLVFAYMQARKLDVLEFADIDYERLVDMKAWIRGEGKGEPTRHKMESLMKSAYKEGLRMKMCSRDLDPYLDYKIERVPERDIVRLSNKQMRKLIAFRCQNPKLQRAKDVLLGSFYLCGLNFQDLYDLPMDDEAVYVRKKVDRRTQKTTHVRVEPELNEIVTRYAGDGRMFNFSAGCRCLQWRLDGAYVELSKEIGFKVNMAIIRRTWVSLAAELECPEYIINQSIGHVDRTVNGVSYREPDWRLTAKWNRKVIDYVLTA